MKLITIVVSLLGLFVERALACRAEYGPQLTVPGFKTNSDYSSLGATKYIIVQALTTAAVQAIQAPAATSSTILGVLQNGPKVGEAMTIAYSGLSKLVAGGALSANGIVTTNGSGRAAAVTSGDMAIGRVLEAAGANGDVVTALLFPPFRWQGDA